MRFVWKLCKTCGLFVQDVHVICVGSILDLRCQSIFLEEFYVLGTLFSTGFA